MIIEKTETFRKWLKNLKDIKARVIIKKRLDKIEVENHFGDHKNVGGDIYELKIHYGPGYRIYFIYRVMLLFYCYAVEISQRRSKILKKQGS